MLRSILLTAFLFLGFLTQAQSIIGKWRTIDDQTGKPISIVEIFEHQGRVFGRVIDILDPKAKKRTCASCEGEDKDKPIIGLVVIKGLQKQGKVYNGEILDPKFGKIYSCNVSLEGKDKLKVRGYLGISLLGRTQYWHRVK